MQGQSLIVFTCETTGVTFHEIKSIGTTVSVTFDDADIGNTMKTKRTKIASRLAHYLSWMRRSVLFHRVATCSQSSPVWRLALPPRVRLSTMARRALI